MIYYYWWILKKLAGKYLQNTSLTILFLQKALLERIYVERVYFSGKTKPQHDATLVELTQLGVLFEVRRLNVGDFMWIARCRKTNVELVIPYIIERKRMDDLSASIIDGRFHEQKVLL